MCVFALEWRRQSGGLPARELPPVGGDLRPTQQPNGELPPSKAARLAAIASPWKHASRPGGATVSEHDCGVWSVWRCASVRKIKAQQHSGVGTAAGRKRAERPAGCSLLCANERRQFESHENCSCFPPFEQKTLHLSRRRKRTRFPAALFPFICDSVFLEGSFCHVSVY